MPHWIASEESAQCDNFLIWIFERENVVYYATQVHNQRAYSQSRSFNVILHRASGGFS